MTLTVPVREFTENPSRYLAEAGRGQTVDIVSDRRTIARLVGISGEQECGLAGLIEQKVVDWSGGKPKGADIPLGDGGPLLSDIVITDRG